MNVGEGAYTLYTSGQIYSHSISADYNKQSGVSFRAGDVVTVELDPSTGELTYSNQGVSYSQSTSIWSGTSRAIHFCVMLSTALDEVSIV